MSKDCLTLSDWRHPFMRVTCEKCGADQVFLTIDLLREYGTDHPLPNIALDLIKCGNNVHYWEWCRGMIAEVGNDVLPTGDGE